jgi:hypothetical protein
VITTIILLFVQDSIILYTTITQTFANKIYTIFTLFSCHNNIRNSNVRSQHIRDNERHEHMEGLDANHLCEIFLLRDTVHHICEKSYIFFHDCHQVPDNFTHTRTQIYIYIYGFIEHHYLQSLWPSPDF